MKKLIIAALFATTMLATHQPQAMEVTAGAITNQTGSMTAENVRTLTDTQLNVLRQQIIDLQNELNTLNQRMNNMINNVCPTGQYVRDFDANNVPICSAP